MSANDGPVLCVIDDAHWLDRESAQAFAGGKPVQLGHQCVEHDDVGHFALERADSTALRQAAHTLKSSSANLGATELARHCAEIEALARSDRLVEARADWLAVTNEYERVKQALQEMLQPVAAH